ncbi:TonB-dependent receptor [Piscinibacter gummiphilus]|uniref:TonB-dependent receptor n=1 Tax=Piscinibacter gummiphilus TaxID=946333 RepID=A0A1W6LHL5_9BURK|nr:TonB-dependent receptor [Piscinibacter gummiphilus]
MNRLSAAVLLALVVPAHAQESATLAPVVVRGQAAATDRALDDQEAADDIRSVVRNDGIGRLPDRNAAEALQRLPGVSIERDQGEGRYVRVRGLGPDLNAVTINGTRVPSPESGRRAVMLDVLPSALIGSASVIKTLTPDMDANSLGGTIDIRTLSAFDQPGRLLSFELGGSHSDNVSKTSPLGSLLFADRFMDGRLGVAFGLNAEQRKFGSDNVETGGAWDGNALEEFERRDYRITRERVGAGLNLEFKPAKGQLYYLRSMASQFSDDEVRNAHTIAFDAPQEAGVLGDAESVRSLKARKETQRIYSLALGTDQTLGDWELNLAGGVSRASETTPRSISAADFDGGTYSNVGFTDGRTPTLLAPASINEAAGYSLSEIELEENAARDREYTLKLDLAKSLPIFGAAGQIKFGGKISRRTKTNDQTTWTSDDFGPAPTDLASYAGPSPRYPFGAFGPTIQPGAIQAILPGSVIEVDEVESVINDYTMKENLDAAYVQSKFQLADWHLIAGVRYEGTRFTASGTGYDEGAGTFMPRDSQHRDDHWLPGLHARHDLDDTTSLRAAWTNTVVRPTFEQLRPGFTIDGSEGEFGNPDLKPLRSSNLDLGIERRLGYAGAVSVYGFHKNIRDFVFQTTADMSAAFPGVTDATTYANGGQAKVYGVELAYTQALRSLPAPWNGLLVGANATFSDSRADVSVGGVSRRITLPSQSKRVFNLVLGWENPVFGVRLAANHKSSYLLEVGAIDDPSTDQYVDAQTQLDLSMRYSVSKSLQFAFDVQNVTDEPYYVYAGSRDRNAQWEAYGRTYRLSMKYNLE